MEEPLAGMSDPRATFCVRGAQAGQVCEHSRWAQQCQGTVGAAPAHSKLEALELQQKRGKSRWCLESLGTLWVLALELFGCCSTCEGLFEAREQCSEICMLKCQYCGFSVILLVFILNV